ncbi:MAG: APC family permease [Cyclobacteriaceae bacterium]
MDQSNRSSQGATGLTRSMGLMGLAATGICSMLGAAINVVPFMIQRNVPGIGSYVLEAYLFAAVPAIFAAICYAILASAMPRAGGSYVYASRSLNPYLGFIASFAQWFGLSIAIGVVSYVLITFLRDIAMALEWIATAELLETGFVRVGLALSFLWIFVYINLRGLKLYERTLIPMMFVMFLLGGIVIIAGYSFNHDDFKEAVLAKESLVIEPVSSPFDFKIFLAAAAVLFSSFIGFDSIAQAGGEAKNPGRTLPLAIIIAILSVGLFYFLFTGAVYHAVPWNFIAEKSKVMDVTAPGLLSYLMPAGWAVAIVGGAAIALINDLPAMLLAVSRLMFAWAEDRIFPKKLAEVHKTWHTPHYAIIASGIMASLGILGSHFAGDFFLGIDILVTSMLVNFLLMCLSVVAIQKTNPEIAKGITVMKARSTQFVVGVVGATMLTVFLIIHIIKDLNADVTAWYFHSTPIWLIVMGVASLIYFREMSKLKKSGVDIKKIFNELPPE